MLRWAIFQCEGPVAVRYPRGGEGSFREDTWDKPVVRLREGTDVTLMAYGTMLEEILKAAELLKEQHISAEVLKLNRIAPLSWEELEPFLGQTKNCLTVAEDCFGAGCAGQRISAILAEHGRAPEQLILKNLGKTFAPEGSVTELEHRCGLDAAGVAAAAEEAVKHGE